MAVRLRWNAQEPAEQADSSLKRMRGGLSVPKRPQRRSSAAHKYGFSRNLGPLQDSLLSNLNSLTRAMDPNNPAGVPFRQDGKGPNEDHATYPSRSVTSSGNNQTMFILPTTGHNSVVNNGATGHFFNQDPHFGQFSQQGGLIPNTQVYQGVSKGYQTNPPFEYSQSPRHAPAAGHNHLHQSLPTNSFMRSEAGMHSTASSSSSVWSGVRTLAPAPPHPSASSSSSYASLGQRPGENYQHPTFSQYPSHAQTSLPLQAMVSNSQRPSEPDPIKLSDEQMEAIKALLIQDGWYAVPDEEPPIRPDDPFITQGLILRTDKTRFSALIFSAPTGGKTFCRIRHSIPTKNKLVDCTFSAVHPKDAIAHVCDYLNYKPYKCKGKGGHAECDSTYSTNERRNDHYAKKKKGPDTHESCEKCGASITARNFSRHREKCLNTNNLEQS